MKKVLLSILTIIIIGLFSCCSSDDNGVIISTDNGNQDIDIKLTGQITSDKILTNDEVWEIEGRVTVTAGTTLTIEQGTIIKAFAGSGANASALIIARGAKIMANGTSDNPIVFTSTADNIQIGQSVGGNLTENDRGLWGGLIVLGNAEISVEGNASESQIEGIPASDTNGLYGGSNNTDNSGVINFISIRHGGAEIGEGNEINGLTLGGVGSGTTITNVEVVGNVDDGIEFFGGTVNVSNALVWAQGDDGLDIDQAYSGTISNSVVVLGDISDHAMEIDGPEGALEGSFTLNGITLIGNTTTENGEYADYRSNAMGVSNNIFARGFKESSDTELDNDGVAENYNAEKLEFGTWQIVLPEGALSLQDIFVNKAENVTVSGYGDNAQAVSNGSETVGANLSDFGWTYANSKGAL
jgi:hypothetical protein|tara:strand:- start:25198 stop:26436 length:1239 start_codon:yes stop_codon:yes gene_type:complete